jgi:hypothetical protein
MFSLAVYVWKIQNSAKESNFDMVIDLFVLAV